MTRSDPADLVVVGGGLIGAWTAFEAVRRHPTWQVTLVERSTVGSGATAHSAGVSFPLAATPGHAPLVRLSRAAYAGLRNTPAHRHLRSLPIIYVTADPGALAGRVVDVPLRPVTATESARLGRMLPDARITAREVVLGHDEPGFVVAAAPLAAALLAGCGAAVTVVAGERVTGVEVEDGGCVVVTADRAVIAGRVVFACGPWSPPPVRPDTLPDVAGGRRKRIAALHVALATEPGDPLVSFVDDDLFVVPTAPAEGLVSFYRQEWDTDPERMDGRPAAADLEAGTAALARRSPALAGAITGGRAFCDLYTPDRLPRVTVHPRSPRVAAIRGGSGSGVRLAPGLAAAALDAVTGSRPDDHILPVERFP